MFQRAGVLVFNQIVEETDVAVIHCILEFAEGDAGGVDDSRFGAEVVDQTDPSLAIENFDVIVGRNIELFHHDCRSLLYLQNF